MKKIFIFAVFTLTISLNLSFVNAIDKTNNFKTTVKEKTITINTQISEKRARFKISYKAKLKINLGSKLSKVSKQKLEFLLKRIDVLSAQIEATKYTQDRKDKLLGQLDALKELAKEALRDEGAVL